MNFTLFDWFFYEFTYDNLIFDLYIDSILRNTSIPCNDHVFILDLDSYSF